MKPATCACQEDNSPVCGEASSILTETIINVEEGHSCKCFSCNCRFIQQQKGLGNLIFHVSIPLRSKTSERIRLQHDSNYIPNHHYKCDCNEMKQPVIREIIKVLSLSFVHEFKSASIASNHNIHSTEEVELDIVFIELNQSQYLSLVSILNSLHASIHHSINNPFSTVHHIKIIIGGMTCSSCTSAIEAFLQKQAGILSCQVDLLSNSGIVDYDSSLVNPNQIISLVEDVGYDCHEIANDFQIENSTSVKIKIEGMTCSSCVESTEKYLLKQQGITACKVNLISNSCQLDYNPHIIGVRDILTLIRGIGYDASLMAEEFNNLKEPNNNELKSYEFSLLLSLIPVFFTFLISMVFTMLLPAIHPLNILMRREIIPGLPLSDVLLFFFSTPVQFGLGYRFYRGAWKSLYYLNNYNMDVLVVLGTSTAYFFSIYLCIRNINLGLVESGQFFETSVFLIFFILVGKYLEIHAKRHTSAAVQQLLSLAPSTAIVVTLENGNIREESEISLDLLQVGDVVLVKKGARIPSDGIVYLGSSYLDESMLTGESNLVCKQVGDIVMAGTISVSAHLFVKITKIGNDNTLARIVSLVHDAQSNRAPIQDIADRISNIFVPSVLICALLTFIIWGFLLFNSIVIISDRSYLIFSVEHAIAVLVIACPCALGLACPTACMVASGVAARFGVLIKGGGGSLEDCSNLSTMVFDKTGTLTEGKPTVTDTIIMEDKFEINMFWKVVVGVEAFSEHPSAKALTSYGNQFIEKELININEEISIDEISEVSGKGMIAKILIGDKSHMIYVGTSQFLEENDCNFNFNEKEYELEILKWKLAGKSVVLFGISNFGIIGAVSLSDQPRSESNFVISELKKRGLDIWLLTGDNDQTARAVATQLGIQLTNVLSEVLPEDKYNYIKELQIKAKGKVAMIGDGINDSIALVQSDVGIAIGVGSEIAIESADVVLVKSDLRDVLILYDLSRATMNKIILNFIWALGYNMLGIPLAAGAFYYWGLGLDPMIAGLAMALSSVSVVVNSLLLNLFRSSGSK